MSKWVAFSKLLWFNWNTKANSRFSTSSPVSYTHLHYHSYRISPTHSAVFHLPDAYNSRNYSNTNRLLPNYYYLNIYNLCSTGRHGLIGVFGICIVQLFNLQVIDESYKLSAINNAQDVYKRQAISRYIQSKALLSFIFQEFTFPFFSIVQKYYFLRGV